MVKQREEKERRGVRYSEKGKERGREEDERDMVSQGEERRAGRKLKGRRTRCSEEGSVYVPVCRRLPRHILTLAHRLNKMMVNRPEEKKRKKR